MRFVEIINKKKITLISIFMFLYVAVNLLVGERGLISFYEKHSQFDNLLKKKYSLSQKLEFVEKRNDLLTGVIDTDYLEILYRKKFMVGKPSEKIYIK
jgi:cell division protein FtsB